MGLLAWIVTGLIAGWLAGKVMKGGGYGILVDIILGILGGIVGGWIFQSVGSAGVTGFNAWSLLVAVVGSVIVLMLYHAIARPHGPSHA